MTALDASWMFHRAWGASQAQNGFGDSQRHLNFARSNLNKSLTRIAKELEEWVSQGGEARLVAGMDSGKTWRHELYLPYKANRPQLSPYKRQFIYEEAPRAMEKAGVELFNSPGFEGDDVLATIALKSRNAGWDVSILASDFDLFQVVGTGIKVVTPKKDRSGYEALDAIGVVKRIGVLPERIPLYKAIAGDTSDNISGVRGFGAVAAKRIATKYVSAAHLYASLSDFTNGERDSLERNKDSVLLFERLCTLEYDCPVKGVSL